MRRPLFVFFVFLIAAAMLASAQSSRTRTAARQPVKTQPAAAPQPETALKWLQARYRVNGSVSYSNRHQGHTFETGLSDTDLSFSRCDVQLSNKERLVMDGNVVNASWWSRNYSFRLGDLSAEVRAAQVEVNEPIGQLPLSVKLVTKTGEKAIRWSGNSSYNKNTSNGSVNTLELIFNDPDIAKRAANALRDAILACGGTKEAY